MSDKKQFYGVRFGGKRGVFKGIEEARGAIMSANGLSYRMFHTREEAHEYVYGPPPEELVRWVGPTNEAKDDAECYCGGCDTYLEEDWVYCPSCGVRLIYQPQLERTGVIC